MIKYTIGADPELFIQNKKGKYVSAHDLLQGTKQQPEPVEGGALHVDGTAAEFNLEPAETADEFVNNIKSVLGVLKTKLEERNQGLKIKVIPSVTFDKRYFKQLPAEAKVLGCSPEKNLYSEGDISVVNIKGSKRTAGGHIHIGWGDFGSFDPADPHHLFDCKKIVSALDITLYLPSLLWDKDTFRKDIYGRPGSFRTTSYGVEYRSLSNLWVADPDLQRWVFDMTMKTCKLLDDSKQIEDQKWGKSLLTRIRNGDEVAREDIWRFHSMLQNMYGTPKLPAWYKDNSLS